MVRLAGFEPTTPWFVAKYSIQLSYSRTRERNYIVVFCFGNPPAAFFAFFVPGGPAFYNDCPTDVIPTMNKAFVKESSNDDDDDLPEGAAPLPPGTKNYITAQGYQRLRDELMHLIDVARPEIVQIV